MTSTPTKAPKWMSEERHAIVSYLVTEKTLTMDDFRKLQLKIPGRDVQQISDQYRRVVKPDILSMYHSASISTPSTPSKKRARKSIDGDAIC